ncbi:CBS domain-containing protein [Cryptosporangium arvum]|uniref:CBS-domain-containing membrane protein n=1 Tax=Cryptosporangium arvum DSM 44712 TaxID=927661 RepID=A0A010ZZ18_9ACTN|nr:CBS domain-containing protein [Cryptosporangium arvum]EXG82462.1 CBS-domain-containing membrane protein [Cryptosporangium arvum DSM 44712]
MSSGTSMFWPDEDPLQPTSEEYGADLPVTTVMRPCVVLGENEPITVAWNRMRAHGEVALVVDGAAHVVGLLGLREVSERWPVRPPLSAEPTAGDALRGVRTCRITATTSVRDAVRTLITDQRATAPVVTADGRGLGVVTALDLLTALTGRSSPAGRSSAQPAGA